MLHDTQAMNAANAAGSVILVLNAGSSSIKCALFDAKHTPLPREALWRDKVEGIGSDGGPPSYHAALESLHARIAAQLGGKSILAVAHRVVHGGTQYDKPTRIDKAVLAQLRGLIPLAPLHQPFALDAIELFLQKQPDLPQIACFDTGFHHTLPEVEKMLPLPYDAWEQGLRRFGFHGLSYEYQSVVLPERYPAANGSMILAHLGNGASLCGMRGLRSVTTTMGFSALDGLMMGTRCGSLDPGALIYLMEVRKLSLDAVGEMLYHQSGLKGVSGLSSDPRVLLDAEAREPRAAAALALYCRRFVHEFGATWAALGGADMLVFTGGIGENSAMMRTRLCAPLASFGLELDAEANTHGTGARLISTPASRVAVAVEPANEEWIAARDAQLCVGKA